MAALRVPAEITHTPGMVVLSVIVTIVASTGALFLLFSDLGRVRIFAMPVMALAVCAIHYSGMAAMVPVPSDKSIDYRQAHPGKRRAGGGIGPGSPRRLAVRRPSREHESLRGYFSSFSMMCLYSRMRWT